MKKRVRLSNYSIIITIISLGILVVLFFKNLQNGNAWAFYPIGAMCIALCLLALFYMPISIEANGKELCINRSLWFKKIPMSQIESVRKCEPTMAERRIFGSGGWFGYWGWFSERALGKYFAFYGRSSECFLVRLHNGRQYMLGCKDPEEMVEYVSSHLN